MRRIFLRLTAAGRVLFALCALVSSVALCQVPPDGTETNPNAIYTVSGTVVNSVTGAPVRRALVRLFEQGERMRLTDGNGQFEFTGLPGGRARITVRKPGFFGEEDLEHGYGSARVTVGPDSPALALKLVPQSVIYGHVKGSDGEPIEGARVMAIASRIVQGRRRWQIVGVTSANEEGEFRIAGLHPGVYLIEADPGDLTRGPSILAKSGEPVSAARDRYTISFYPSGTDAGSATPLEVSAGQQLNIELALRRAPVYRVSGTIVGRPPNSGTQVMFLDSAGNQFSALRQFNTQTGEFEAEIPAGAYTLSAMAWLPTGKQLTAEIPVNITGDTAGIRLALRSAEPTPVFVRTESRKPEGDRSSLVNLHLIQVGDAVVTRELYSVWVANRKEGPVLPDVPPGRYFVDVQTGGNWYVQSALCGTTDLLHEPLTVAAGAQIPPIEVVIRDDGATLSGHVDTGQSQSPATVVLIPDRGPSNETRIAGTGPGGEFSVNNLAPGNYSVLAFDDLNGLEYANPEVMEAYTAQAAHVSLEPNGQSQVAVELTHMAN